MEQRTTSAPARQSAGSSEDRELMAAYHQARARAAVPDPGAEDMQKADFSSVLPMLRARTGASAPASFDPWELERRKADSYNAISEPPDETGWNCPECKNKGQIYEIRPLGDGSPGHIIRPCKCQATRRTIRRMQQSGLENIIHDNLFPKFEATEPWQQTVKDAAMEYAKNPNGWFYIGGQSGCGKTHLCTAICREELLRGRQVVYMMWRDDAPRLKTAVNREDYPTMVDQYKKAPVLYIDDLFKTGRHGDAKVMPTSADVNLAYEIINFRYVGKLPTIISSEFLLKELVDIDEALTGRIAQMAGGNSFNIKLDRGKNYRLKGMVEL